jgi:N-acyl-D-amino-acid deacylase
MHDLVIRSGTVVDGTGATRFTGDVAVTDGVVTEVGRVEGPARRELDADGLVVTPGFVDVHTHFDGQATWDPHLTPSCWHGVTTAVLGNCGVGFAPVHPDRRQWLIELMEGVEDIPGSALAEGIAWDWETFPEYLDALEAMPRSLDIGAQVPHAALRAYVMGDRAHDPATAEDLAAMTALVGDALRAGALGFSTGRTAGHRDVHGQPVPGTFAAADEVAALLATMAAEGRGVLQVVPAGISGEMGGDAKGAMDGELAWILRLGQAYDRPITFLVMESGRHPDRWRGWFDQVRAANQGGARIRPQVASRCFGMLFGHQSRMNPWRHRPAYRALEGLGFDAMVADLARPDVRAAILADVPDPPTGPPSADQYVEHLFDRLFPLGPELDYEPRPDDSVAAQAARTGQDPWAVTYDLMLGSAGRDFLLHPLLNYGRGSYDGLHDMLVDPLTVQGLGDAGAHCGIICDASMTTYLLTHWTRDRRRGPRLELEWAVRRLTRDPAELYELGDRGTLEPGRRADVNLIDLEHLALLRPSRVDDLPGGAGRLVQGARGYVATVVAGQVTVEDGELTDARPGRLIRGPRSA